MTLDFTPLHPHFVAQASPISLREIRKPEVFEQIRAGMDRHAVLIYDNRATMHRARPFDDSAQRRELRRVTTLDIEA